MNVKLEIAFRLKRPAPSPFTLLTVRLLTKLLYAYMFPLDTFISRLMVKKDVVARLPITILFRLNELKFSRPVDVIFVTIELVII